MASPDVSSPGVPGPNRPSSDSPRAIDDPQVIERIHEYRAALEAGDNPDYGGLLAEYPEIADELAACLDALAFVHQVVPQLRDQANGGVGDEAKRPEVRPVGSLGDFRIVREIGRGGMGVVYEAEQVSLGRRVALKVLPFAAVLDPKHLQRFKNEAQAAAQLHHTNIVPVHAVGCERGVHYYAMQYIEGQTLAQVIGDLRRLEQPRAEAARDAEVARSSLAGTLASGQFAPAPSSPGPEDATSAYVDAETPARPAPSDTGREPQAAISTERSTRSPEFCRSVAQLGVQVAEALDYAHDEGVVHRDIKPSNLILDGKGKVWITDFGLARMESEPGLTMTGDILGTLRYMSPEQALAKRIPVDHRTDVYSLGVTLYELLTLQPAFPGEDREEVLRRIAFEEPKPPRRLNKAVPGELQTIVLKAMAKNPAERYATAGELAEDLQCFLEDRPIRARRPTLLQKATKWSRRHKAMVSTVAVSAALLLIAVTGGALVVANQEHRARLREETLRQQAEDAQRDAERNYNLAVKQEQRAKAFAEESRLRLVRMTVANGVRLLDEGDLPASLVWFAEALKLDRGHPAVEERHRIRFASILQRCPKPVQVWFHQGAVKTAQFSPDGRRVLTASMDKTARVWDAVTGEPVTPPFGHRGAVTHAAFSPDGNRVVTASMGSRSAQVWDAVRGEPITPPLEHDDGVTHAEFSPDGRRVVTASDDKTARVWDAATGKPITPPLEHDKAVRHVSFSPDGRRVVVAVAQGVYAGQGRMAIWDVQTAKRLVRVKRRGGIPRAAFSPDGTRVVTAHWTGTAQVWDAATGEPAAPELRLAGRVGHVAFSPDGRHVLAASGAAQVWDAANGEPVGKPMQHEGGIRHAAFSLDGRRIVTASEDHRVRVWDAATGEPVTPFLNHAGRVNCAELSADGRFLLTASDDHTARLWDLAAAQPPCVSLRDSMVTWVMDAAFSPDGRRVVTAAGRARVWDAATGKPALAPFKRHLQVGLTCASFSADGSRLVTAGWDAAARVWDAETGEALTPPLEHDRGVLHASLSPDGSRLVTAGFDGTARIWDATTGEPITPPLEHEGQAHRAEFSPDGRRVVIASHPTRVWDAATGKPVSPPLGRGAPMLHAAFSPDGRRVVTTRHDRIARVWDATTGEPVTPPLVHHGRVAYASFSPDSGRLVTASWDGTARVWGAQTGQPLTPPMKHTASVDEASFSPDGRYVVTATIEEGNSARVWDAATGEPVTVPMKHFGRMQAASFSPDGRRVLTASRDYTAVIWDLGREGRPIEDLILLAQLLAGHRIDAVEALTPLEPAELTDAWEKVGSEYASDFVASPEQISAWHLQEAEDCERKGRWTEAIAHFDRLVAARPDHPMLFGRRGAAYLELRQWEEAFQDFSEAAKLDPGDRYVLYPMALSAAATGDADAYRATCQEMLDQLGDTEDPSTANTIAWTCALMPDAVEELTRCVELAEHTVELTATSALGPALNTLGVVLYRAGDFEGAIERLSKCVELQEHWADWFFLGAAHHRLGHREEANKWLEKALQHADTALGDANLRWDDRISLQLLRQEMQPLAKDDQSADEPQPQADSPEQPDEQSPSPPPEEASSEAEQQPSSPLAEEGRGKGETGDTDANTKVN